MSFPNSLAPPIGWLRVFAREVFDTFLKKPKMFVSLSLSDSVGLCDITEMISVLVKL